MKSTFEKMGGTYTLGADGIYYPNLVSTDEEPHYGKYGMMRKTYLKEYRPAMYSLYMLEDRLVEHLNLVDDEAQERMDILVRQMMERQGITEELKARDQIGWVRAENNIRNVTEEIGYKAIAVVIGSSKENVRYFCKTHGIDGNAELVKLNFEEHKKHPETCKFCGGRITRIPHSGKKLYCSDECRRAWWKEHPGEANHSKDATYKCECNYYNEYLDFWNKNLEDGDELIHHKTRLLMAAARKGR